MKCKPKSSQEPPRSMIWLTASKPQCNGDSKAMCCMVGGSKSTGTHMPPIAASMTTDIAPNGVACVAVLNMLPTK